MDKSKFYLNLSKCTDGEIKETYKKIKNSDQNIHTQTERDLINGIVTHCYWFLFFDGNAWNQNETPLSGRTELLYPEFIKLFEEPTKLPSELLKEYFENTPREQVLKDWESTAHLDDVNSPKVIKLFEGGDENNGWIKIESEVDLPKEVDQYWFASHNNKIEIRFYNPNWIDDRVQFRRRYTHYQPIQKPKPPKF